MKENKEHIISSNMAHLLSESDLAKVNTREELLDLLEQKNHTLAQEMRAYQAYRDELKGLQIELLKFQEWVVNNNKRIAILYEGRDAAGKGGAIRRFRMHLNPIHLRVVALNKPTAIEQGQWYFRRYIKELPNAGEIVLFDRSWYNRAVVEPVMGFATDAQYNRFMTQVTEFENMLHEEDTTVIKFWFSISKKEQRERFNDRILNDLKRWKFSPVDRKGQALWDEYTYYKEQMFSRTHTSFCPWVIVRANIKRQARIESIRYVLSRFEYDGKSESSVSTLVNPDIVQRYHRSLNQDDI
ncbi:MAG: polyphosphate kinase 2 [Bacteroidota bacterium]|nr:polyphosphate kinase 2 [Bacteroidota bacterium]